MQAHHWLLLAVVFIAGYVAHSVYPKAGQMVGLS